MSVRHAQPFLFPTNYDRAQDQGIMESFVKEEKHLERLDDGLAEVKKEGVQHLHDLIHRIDSLELEVQKLSKIVKLFTQHANTSAPAPACLHFVDLP